MSQPLEAMNLSRMFEASIQLIGATWRRHLRILLVVWLPGALLFLVASILFIAQMKTPTVTEEFGDAGPYLFSLDMMPYLAFLIFSGIVAILCSVYTQAALTVSCAAEMEGDVPEMESVFQFVSGTRFFLLLAQYFALGALAVVVFVVPAILGAFISGTIGSVLPVLVLLLAALPFVIYFMIRWYFCDIVLLWEEEDILDSFARSSQLVDGYWWRTLGIMTLFSISVSIASSIVTMPISIITSISDLPLAFPQSESAFEFSTNPALRQLLASVNSNSPLTMLISWLLGAIGASAYRVVMFYDLRARTDVSEEGDAEQFPPSLDDMQHLL